MRVTVLDAIEAFAGNDTTIIVGQPLQMTATGGVGYVWSPEYNLSAMDVSNPVALFTSTTRQNVYKYKVNVFNEAGCVDSAFVNVTVFASGPDVFVPNAFTPNGDGRNDYFEPVGAGATIERFEVFNRWGQLLFSSSGKLMAKWDGNYGGNPQPSGTFVWVLQGTDFLGRKLVKKGTVTLIR